MTTTPTRTVSRRLSLAFLCAAPFIAIPLVAVRDLRVPGLSHGIGSGMCLLICLGAWTLGLRALRRGAEEARLFAAAGGLLLVPFTLVSLLWVGIGTPWESTPAENQLRYLVLLAGACAVTIGFFALKEAMTIAGDRFYSTLGFGAGLLGGVAYLVWLCLQLGLWTARVRIGEAPDAYASLNDGVDMLLFVACVLTYLATAAFAVSMKRTHSLRGWACAAIVVISGVAAALVMLRGLSFPDPTASSAPWFTRPGFIAGIPAVPWLMPHLMGVALLSSAGDMSEE